MATAEGTVSIEAGATETVTVSPVVEKPELWSTDDPNLYYVRTEIIANGNVTDTYETSFGFRWFTFDSLGFHVNGENVKLNGVCLHHDQGAALGSAAYYDAMYRQLSIMKDMGANAIRTSHNPADEQFIEICSELGLLVIEEAFDGLVDLKNDNVNDFSKYFEKEIGADNALIGAEATMTYSEFAARSMVRRDRNAAAIFAWSFGNEIQEGTRNWPNAYRYYEIAAKFCQWIKDEDGTRPATIGDNNRGGDSRIVNVLNTIIDNGGIIGFNYSNSASSLYTLASRFGGDYGCIIASETSSATNSRSQYKNQYSNSNSDGKFHLTSYDTSSVPWGITAHDSIYNTYQYDKIAGEFVWTGFDYLGEPTPWNGTTLGYNPGNGTATNSSFFGIVDTTGFEKDTYYLYRSQWNKDATTLHLVTAWDSRNMMTNYYGQTPVWVYSNAPVVKLYRDDTLIGTATRVDHVSEAGHTYYTYTTQSNNSDVCSTSSGYGADGLYAIFNVAYTSGTISAKAFDVDGTEIQLTGNSGKNSVTTPDAVSKLNVTQNKTEITADGTSLAYITVDVLDANGNLDTTATNNITFTLKGNGKILGVDNGDQSTTAKGQQKSVLTSATTANINAYAGKALVVVQSTTEAGGFTVEVASTGLTGGTATVNTVEDKNAVVNEGLTSYAMVRDYTVTAGTAPELLTTASGTMADGSTVTGSIVWEEISENIYGTAGDYTISGTLTFDGEEPLPVKARLHVIANIIALRNISTVTGANTVPTLPATVNGVLADGTLNGEFIVTCEEFKADDFATVGDVVVINGTATIIGTKTLPVTASVRVAEQVNTESVNVGTSALNVTQDIPQGYWSDVLSSVNNGVTKPGDNTNERWTNWNYRTRSAEATLTFTWATAQTLEKVNIFYYYDNCCAYPESIEFSYSLNGVDYEPVNTTAALKETFYLGEQHSYTFDQPINPVGIKIKFTQQNGTTGRNCVGVTEAQFMTFAGTIEVNSSALLSSIIVDDTALNGFNAETFSYEADGEEVEAETSVNAGITVLPVYEGVVRILTISEDGSTEYTYEITITPPSTEPRPGDVNMDGRLTNTDVVTLAKYLVKIGDFTEDQLIRADFDGSGLINNSDLVKLARYIVG